MTTSWRDIVPPLLAVGVTSLISLLALAPWFSPTSAIVVVVIGGMLGVIMILGWSMRRAKRIARLHAEARGLVRTPGSSLGSVARVLSVPDPDAPQDEVAKLRQTLGDLAGLMQSREKELAKKSRNLETLVDTLVDVLIVSDSNDEVLLCNAAAERFTRAARASLVGRPIRGIFTRREVLDLHAAARRGLTMHGRVTLLTDSGQRTYQINASPLPAAWGDGVFGVLLLMRDITELAQTNRMQTDFVANASHELRTPIAAIRMANETLLDGAVDDLDMRSRLLETIATHVARLEELVRDLMDLSRAETTDLPVTLEPIDLVEKEVSLRQIFEPICAQRQLSLAFNIAPELEVVVSDRRLLGLILRNLIDNATKFAHEGTEIRCSAIMIAAAGTKPAMVRFEVADKGIGIPLAHQDKVFERFYQVDPARTGVSNRRGTGLGLAIVRKAAEALGGSASISSSWGIGTTVTIELPMHTQSLQSA